MAAQFGNGVVVDWAMRYGNPSIRERLTALKAAGCNRILIAPLYPQYSGRRRRRSTTRSLKRCRNALATGAAHAAAVS